MAILVQTFTCQCGRESYQIYVPNRRHTHIWCSGDNYIYTSCRNCVAEKMRHIMYLWLQSWQQFLNTNVTMTNNRQVSHVKTYSSVGSIDLNDPTVNVQDHLKLQSSQWLFRPEGSSSVDHEYPPVSVGQNDQHSQTKNPVNNTLFVLYGHTINQVHAFAVLSQTHTYTHTCTQRQTAHVWVLETRVWKQHGFLLACQI